jgi:ferredoxin-NADP reductase
MDTFDVTLKHQETIALATKAFHFGKPAGFVFRPGQALDLILPAPGDAVAANSRHTFSIVSAPFEDELVVATRMRDSVFKAALDAMKPGAAARIQGPSGSLVLHRDSSRPAVLIAGGIGVTPFMSMLRQAAHERSPQRLALLYSNRRPRSAPFLGELHSLERRHRPFRLVATMTEGGASAEEWCGPRGRIDAHLVAQLGAEWEGAIFYVAGPPALVAAMRAMLERARVDSDDVRSEEFYGY